MRLESLLSALASLHSMQSFLFVAYQARIGSFWDLEAELAKIPEYAEVPRIPWATITS